METQPTTLDPDTMTPEQLRDEVWYWRTEAAADLGFRLTALDNPQLTTDFKSRAALKRRIGTLFNLLRNVLSGDIFEGCDVCGKDIRPGDALIRDVNMGDCHAECMGTPEIKGGIPVQPGDVVLVDPESVVGDDDEPVADSDGRLTSYAAERLYTTAQIAAKLDRARAAAGLS